MLKVDKINCVFYVKLFINFFNLLQKQWFDIVLSFIEARCEISIPNNMSVKIGNAYFQFFISETLENAVFIKKNATDYS